LGPYIAGARFSDVVATPPSSSAWPQRPILKKMPTKELQKLIQSTKTMKGEKPSVRRDIRADQRLPQGPQQWEKLDCRVCHPFQTEDIAKQDIFAVVEAGHTQFKGKQILL
jgi:nitrate/TMAO reductase-like tetraheme cytochrome c subunit